MEKLFIISFVIQVSFIYIFLYVYIYIYVYFIYIYIHLYIYIYIYAYIFINLYTTTHSNKYYNHPILCIGSTWEKKNLNQKFKI